MGLYDRDYYRDEESRPTPLPSSEKSIVTTLIIINVAVYVVSMFIGNLDPRNRVVSALLGPDPRTELLQQNLEVPAGALDVKVQDIMAARPSALTRPWLWWKFVTYGFAHSSINMLHLIGNMLMLFFFGREVEGVYGKRRFLGMYLTALILGSVIWSLIDNVVSSGPIQGSLIGASGAVMSVLVLFAIHFPRRTVLFMLVIPIPAWVFGILYVLHDLFQYQTQSASRVAYDVHLVGAAYGAAFYYTRWELGKLVPANFAWKPSGVRRGLKVHDPDSHYDNLDGQADLILDKMHRLGESSLTDKERRILEAYSRRMRQKHR